MRTTTKRNHQRQVSESRFRFQGFFLWGAWARKEKELPDTSTVLHCGSVDVVVVTWLCGLQSLILSLPVNLFFLLSCSQANFTTLYVKFPIKESPTTLNRIDLDNLGISRGGGFLKRSGLIYEVSLTDTPSLQNKPHSDKDHLLSPQSSVLETDIHASAGP